MKQVLFLFCFTLMAGALWSQQQSQTTQFMYYKQGYNPGVAGNREAPNLTAIFRKQWIGVEGAPELQVVSFHAPLRNQRIGLGANIVRRAIGITEQYHADFMYAYRVPLGSGNLGLGVQATVQSLSMNFADDRLRSSQPLALDQSIPDGAQQQFSFNFGTGAYYSGESFYLGVSVPRLLTNSVDLGEDELINSREVQHLYLMTGFSFNLGGSIQLQPQALVKYTLNVDPSVDLNLTSIFSGRVFLGGTYRTGGSPGIDPGASVDVLAGAQLSDSFLFGLSYEFTLSGLNTQTNGSAEIMIQYTFTGDNPADDYINPRFF